MTLLVDPPAVAANRVGDVAERQSPPLRNGDAFRASLGGIPWHRIIFNPPPRTVSGSFYDAIEGRLGEHLVELVDGTLVEKPVGLDESRIAANLLTDLNVVVRQQKLGFVAGEAGTVRMSGGNRRMPDVAVYLRADYPEGQRPKDKVPTLPPRLAVEVLSEDNTPAEIDMKLRELFASGCRLAYVIDPKQQAARRYTSADDVTTVDAAGTLDGGDVVPGFAVKLADILADE